MLQQIDPSEKVITEVSILFKALKINQLLLASNVRKAGGVSVQQVFEFIFLLAFFGKRMNNFLARVFDHAGQRFVKGFTMLTLGWSDGYSFIPSGWSNN